MEIKSFYRGDRYPKNCEKKKLVKFTPYGHGKSEVTKMNVQSTIKIERSENLFVKRDGKSSKRGTVTESRRNKTT